MNIKLLQEFNKIILNGRSRIENNIYTMIMTIDEKKFQKELTEIENCSFVYFPLHVNTFS